MKGARFETRASPIPQRLRRRPRDPKRRLHEGTRIHQRCRLKYSTGARLHRNAATEVRVPRTSGGCTPDFQRDSNTPSPRTPKAAKLISFGSASHPHSARSTHSRKTKVTKRNRRDTDGNCTRRLPPRGHTRHHRRTEVGQPRETGCATHQRKLPSRETRETTGTSHNRSHSFLWRNEEDRRGNHRPDKRDPRSPHYIRTVHQHLACSGLDRCIATPQAWSGRTGSSVPRSSLARSGRIQAMKHSQAGSLRFPNRRARSHKRRSRQRLPFESLSDEKPASDQRLSRAPQTQNAIAERHCEEWLSPGPFEASPSSESQGANDHPDGPVGLTTKRHQTEGRPSRSNQLSCAGDVGSEATATDGKKDQADSRFREPEFPATRQATS